MSTDLDQLFADVRGSALPPSHVDLDRVVARGRRRRASVRAREGATIALAGAVVVGGGAFALSGGALGARGTVQSGSGGTGTATAAPATSAAATPPPPVSVTMSASAEATQPAQGSSDPTEKPNFTPTTVNGKQVLWAGTWPEGLEQVMLPDVPGFGTGRRFPDALEPSGDFNGILQKVWTATFGIGSADATGPQATIFVGDFPLPATSGTPVLGQSPGPITDTPVVRGHQAYVTHDGDQPILYFRTSHWTVQVCGWNASVEQLVAVAESLQNVD
jgi:hypothetical protein